MNDELGPLLRRHPRALALEKARRELADYLAGWNTRHALTSAEYLAVLTELAASHCQRLVADARMADCQCLVAVERRADSD